MMGFDEEKYKTTVPYPVKRDYVSYRVMTTEGELKGTYTIQEELEKDFGTDLYMLAKSVRSKAVSDGKASTVCDDYVVVVIYDDEAYHAAQKAYGNDQRAVNDKFYHDCCENVGYDPDSKLAQLIYNKAYEDGHSSGYHSVWNEMEDLSDFADRIIEAAKHS